MSHSPAWMVFLPDSHCGSHVYELQIAPSSPAHS